MSHNAHYTVTVRDKDGTFLGEFENASGLRFSKRLNNYGSCEFQVPYNDPKLESLVSLRRYEVYIKRDDTVVWAGEQVSRDAELIANSPNFVTIRSFDFLEVLNSRFTASSVIYRDSDAGSIAWDLINTSQSQTNGDYGFTEGFINLTVNRDRKYYNQNILEAIINLSNVIGGFDFEITDDKVFNVYDHKGITKNAIVFEWGNNIERVKIDENFTKIINRSIILGEGFETSQTRIERNDLTTQAIYSLREDILSETTVSEQETLEDKGDAVLRKYKQRLMKVNFSQLPTTQPQFGSWTLGDTVRIKINAGFYDIENFFRIYGWEINLSKDNKESISYTVGLI